MRKFLKVSLLVALFCALMQVAFTSCSDSDDPKPAPAPEPANIPQYLFIYVKNESGENLLNPETSGNLVGELEGNLKYDEKFIPSIGMKSRSRAYISAAILTVPNFTDYFMRPNS